MYSGIVHGTVCSGIDFLGERHNGAGPAKGKSSWASGGVELASRIVPEERAAWDPSIHVI